MKSKASIAGHPIHPALVAFPVVYYASTVAALIAHVATQDPFWFRAAMTANIAGVVMALVAAIPGAVDLFAGVPKHTNARRTGLIHGAANVIALVLFASTAYVLYRRWDNQLLLDARGPLVLAIVGLGATMVAGVLGWKLVQTHHVGVSPSPDLSIRDREVGPPRPVGHHGRTPSDVRAR
jgi:uncharacterized membrane protein